MEVQKVNEYNTESENNEASNEKKEETTETPKEPSGDSSEESESKSPLVKLINKFKSDVKKIKEKFTDIFRIIRDGLILGILLLLVFTVPFMNKPSIKSFFNSSAQVVIISKTTENGCYELKGAMGESYCVDKDSYSNSVLGLEYEIYEGQYEYHLREGARQ